MHFLRRYFLSVPIFPKKFSDHSVYFLPHWAFDRLESAGDQQKQPRLHDNCCKFQWIECLAAWEVAECIDHARDQQARLSGHEPPVCKMCFSFVYWDTFSFGRFLVAFLCTRQCTPEHLSWNWFAFCVYSSERLHDDFPPRLLQQRELQRDAREMPQVAQTRALHRLRRALPRQHAAHRRWCVQYKVKQFPQHYSRARRLTTSRRVPSQWREDHTVICSQKVVLGASLMAADCYRCSVAGFCIEQWNSVFWHDCRCVAPQIMKC